MLKKLIVHNFALIANAELDLQNGFTVITGETGSGKSILLGALKLILGERADLSLVRDESKKTIVEGYFQLKKSFFQAFFDKNDLDYADETILRREINANGRSRAFINDTPVQLSVLKELTAQLIFIHSQHHTLSLKNKKFQLDLLDSWANSSELKNELKKQYKCWKTLENKIEALEKKVFETKKESDYNQFQLEELDRLELENTNFLEIENAVNRMEQIEEIKAHFELIDSIINEENGVNQLLLNLQKKAPKDDKLEELLNRTETARIELLDVASAAEDERLNVDVSPDEIQQNIELLNRFNAALNKHRLTSQEELLELKNKLQEAINKEEDLETNLEKLKQEKIQVYGELIELSQNLSALRKSKKNTLAKELIKLLKELKLPDTKLLIELEEKAVGEDGIDEINLLFTPNKGMSPQAIEKAASGGELSRLMLAIQYILSRSKSLPTMIFDEIDTGVSGEVADRIGQLLRKMGENMQLLAITHLPQVAGKGAHHIAVIKKSEKKQTITSFKQLSNDERVDEIAQLMSGKEINTAARENAKKLMK